MMNRKLCLPWVLLVCSGCASTAGVAEFESYAAAFDQVAISAEPLLVKLRLSERKIGMADIDAGEKVNRAKVPKIDIDASNDVSIAERFDVAHASYFAKSGDPPFTAAMRFSVDSVRRYNATLLRFARGEALEQVQADLSSSLTEGKAFMTAFNLVDAAGSATPGIGVAINALNEVLDAASQTGSREAFRTDLRNNGEKLQLLLTEIRNSTPSAFDTLTRDSRSALVLAVAISDQAAIDSNRKQIEKARELLGEWVQLVNISSTALAAAISAIDADSGAAGRIASAAALSADLRVRALRVRELAFE